MSTTERSSSSSSIQKQSKRQQDDQPLKRSTYNIFEAYDVDMSTDSLLDATTVHPLQTTCPYSHDLSPHAKPTRSDQGDLSNMMKDLDLTSAPTNTIDMKRSGTMPYCV
jgi:hypothetical protein